MASSKHLFMADQGWNDAGVISADKAPIEPNRAIKPPDEPTKSFNNLVRTIEGEIIPRLVLAHAPVADKDGEPVAEGRLPTRAEVEEFTQLILAHDGVVASNYVDGLRKNGMSLEAVFLHLLAPTARRLGDLWTADLCDFARVTIGLGRLQQLLRELSHSFQGESEHWDNGRRALLTAIPGEQHTLGILIVAEFLRRAGWDVLGWPMATKDELVDVVHSEWFAVVGLSLGSEAKLDELASVIHAVREASRNGSIGIMVGGPVFIEHPEYVAIVGADATAADARLAALQAENLLALLPPD